MPQREAPAGIDRGKNRKRVSITIVIDTPDDPVTKFAEWVAPKITAEINSRYGCYGLKATIRDVE